MITRTQAFSDSSGQFHKSLEEAQRAELGILIGTSLDDCSVGDAKCRTLDLLMKNSSKVIDILTTKKTSLVRARRVNGGTKKAKSHVINNNRITADTIAA